MRSHSPARCQNSLESRNQSHESPSNKLRSPRNTFALSRAERRRLRASNRSPRREEDNNTTGREVPSQKFGFSSPESMSQRAGVEVASSSKFEVTEIGSECPDVCNKFNAFDFLAHKYASQANYRTKAQIIPFGNPVIPFGNPVSPAFPASPSFPFRPEDGHSPISEAGFNFDNCQNNNNNNNNNNNHESSRSWNPDLKGSNFEGPSADALAFNRYAYAVRLWIMMLGIQMVESNLLAEWSVIWMATE